PTLSWGNKDALEIASELGFDPRLDPEEIAVINQLISEDQLLQDFVAATHTAWTKYNKPPYEHAAAKVYFRAAELQQSAVWVKEAGPGSVDALVDSLFRSGELRVACLDLGSLTQ